MSNLTIIEGHLQLSGQENSGTVALIDQKANVIASTPTNLQGWFSFYAHPGSGMDILGFPGQTLNASQITEALNKKETVYYETAVQMNDTGHMTVYLNGASSIVAAFAKKTPTATNDDIQAQARPALFGNNANILLAGYSTEFLAHIGATKIYSNDIFLHRASQVGGVQAFASHLAQNGVPDGHFAGYDLLGTPAVPAVSAVDAQIPAIPSSGKWADQYDNWNLALSINNNTYMSTIPALAKLSDGLAASAAAGQSEGSQIAQFLIKLTLAGLEAAAETPGQKVAAAVGSQLFSFVQPWIFGDPDAEVKGMLKDISNQLNTVIQNQIMLSNNLNVIVNLLKDMKKNDTLLALAPIVSIINSNVQAVYGNATTQTGVPPETISTLSKAILDTNNGVYYALTAINDIIMGTSGSTSLPQALFDCLSGTGAINGADRNFLSNKNFFMPMQAMFSFYLGIQMQGVQMVMQAYNYQAGVPDTLTSPLSWSGDTATFYNDWVIGASGSPFLAKQRDAYRALTEPYYQNFVGYMGALPDDVATGLLPEVANQPAPVFYNKESGLLSLGIVSYKLRQWTSGYLATCNDLSQWNLPGEIRASLRVPSMKEINNLIGQGLGNPTYNGNYYSYLKDQGYTDDSSQYNATFFEDVRIWNTEHSRFVFMTGNRNKYPIYDVNRALVTTPSDLVLVEGTFPSIIKLQGNPVNAFSQSYGGSSDPHDPQSNSDAWDCYYNKVYGSLSVINAKPLQITISALYDAASATAYVMSSEGQNYAPYIYAVDDKFTFTGPTVVPASAKATFGNSAFVLSDNTVLALQLGLDDGQLYLSSLDLNAGISGGAPISGHPYGFAEIRAIHDITNKRVYVVLISRIERQPYYLCLDTRPDKWGWTDLIALPAGDNNGFVSFDMTMTTNTIQAAFLGYNSLPTCIYKELGIHNDWTYGENAFPNPNNQQYSRLAINNISDCGRLILLDQGNHLPYLLFQADAKTGVWSWGDQLSTDHAAGFNNIVTVVDSNNVFHVILTGIDDGMPYHLSQATDGTWSWGGQIDAGTSGYDNMSAVADNSGSVYLFMSHNNIASLTVYTNGSWQYKGQITM